jgi:hypothetical protein
MGVSIDRAPYGPVGNADVDAGIPAVRHHHVGQVHAEGVQAPKETACKAVGHGPILLPPLVSPVDLSDDPRHTDGLPSAVGAAHGLGAPTAHGDVPGAVSPVSGVSSLESAPIGGSSGAVNLRRGDCVGKLAVELLVTRYPALYAAPHVGCASVSTLPFASHHLRGRGALCVSLCLSQPLGKPPPLPVGVSYLLLRVPNGGSLVFQKIGTAKGRLNTAVETGKILVFERVPLGDRALVDPPPNVLGVGLDGFDVLPLLTVDVGAGIEAEGFRIGTVGLPLHIGPTGCAEELKARGPFPREHAPIGLHEGIGKIHRLHRGGPVSAVRRFIYRRGFYGKIFTLSPLDGTRIVHYTRTRCDALSRSVHMLGGAGTPS